MTGLLPDLFLTFARIGVCTFGGGYAMLPILQRELVERWSTPLTACGPASAP